MVKLKSLISEGVIWKKADPDKYYKTTPFSGTETAVIKGEKYRPKQLTMNVYNYSFEYVENPEDVMSLYVFLGKYLYNEKKGQMVYGFTVERFDHQTDDHKVLQHGITKPFLKEDAKILKKLIPEIFNEYKWGIKK